MMNANRKLAEIQHVVALWQEPGSPLTSAEVMMEIRDVLDDVPRALSSGIYEDHLPTPKALRAKSSFVG